MNLGIITDNWLEFRRGIEILWMEVSCKSVEKKTMRVKRQNKGWKKKDAQGERDT